MSHSLIVTLKTTGCLDLVISLISNDQQTESAQDTAHSSKPARDGALSLVIGDIEKAIGMERKANKAQERASRKRSEKQQIKAQKDLQRSRKPSAQLVTSVIPIGNTPPEKIDTPPEKVDTPSEKINTPLEKVNTVPKKVEITTAEQLNRNIVDRAVAQKEAEDEQKETAKLRMHAFLAVATFVDHGKCTIFINFSLPNASFVQTSCGKL